MMRELFGDDSDDQDDQPRPKMSRQSTKADSGRRDGHGRSNSQTLTFGVDSVRKGAIGTMEKATVESMTKPLENKAFTYKIPLKTAFVDRTTTEQSKSDHRPVAKSPAAAEKSRPCRTRQRMIKLFGEVSDDENDSEYGCHNNRVCPPGDCRKLRTQQPPLEWSVEQVFKSEPQASSPGDPPKIVLRFSMRPSPTTSPETPDDTTPVRRFSLPAALENLVKESRGRSGFDAASRVGRGPSSKQEKENQDHRGHRDDKKHHATHFDAPYSMSHDYNGSKREDRAYTTSTLNRSLSLIERSRDRSSNSRHESSFYRSKSKHDDFRKQSSHESLQPRHSSHRGALNYRKTSHYQTNRTSPLLNNSMPSSVFRNDRHKPLTSHRDEPIRRTASFRDESLKHSTSHYGNGTKQWTSHDSTGRQASRRDDLLECSASYKESTSREWASHRDDSVPYSTSHRIKRRMSHYQRSASYQHSLP